MTLSLNDVQLKKALAKSKKSSIDSKVFVDSLNESEKDEW